MLTSLQADSRIRRLCMAGAFLCGALMLSLAESIILPAGILPIPGAKPGLANAAVLLCAVILGRKYACAVSLARVLLMFILFGNGSSAVYSVSGALLSLMGVAVFCNSKHLSFLGKSVIAAICHNAAQLLCAVFVFEIPALALMPWMIFSAVLCGGITGILLNMSYSTLLKAIGNKQRHTG